MADASLQSLADALKNASQPVTLNASFIQNAGIAPPANFDDALKAAFRLGTDSGLEVRFAAGDVGPVSNDSFRVTNASLPKGFLNTAEKDTKVTMTFSAPGGGALEVQIEAGLSNWSFSTFFTFMTGWPFNLLSLASATFVFSTDEVDSYAWNGTTVALAPGQNFAGTLTVPSQFQPIFNLAEGLGVVPATLAMFGPIDVSKADNGKVLYPDMSLRAPIGDVSVKIFFLTARKPYLGFRIETSKETITGEDGTEVAIQTPSFFFGLELDITDTSGQTIALDFEASLSQDASSFGFTLQADSETEALLTPATVASALMNGNSYFQYVPAPLQSLLTTIGFKALAITGPLQPKPGLTIVSITLGSQSGKPVPLFTDPTNGQVFTIESIDLTWTIVNPLDGTTRANLVQFSSTFKLWPEVFRTKDDKPGGVFSIAIDQDFNVDGAFSGSVSLDNLLRTVTKGVVGLPPGVEVSFSDISISLSPSAKTYAFAFTFDGQLDFITWSGKPLVQFQGMRFAVAMSTPTSGDKAGTTVYRASMAGLISVGPIGVDTFVQYDGTVTPKVWTLSTSLAAPLSIQEVIAQLFRDYTLPDFLPTDLTIEAFSLDARIPTGGSSSAESEALAVPGDGSQASYRVAATLDWKYNGLANFPIETRADFGLQYDGNKPTGQQFAGSVIGTLTLASIGVEVMIGYQFGTAAQQATALGLPAASAAGDSRLLWIQWEGIRATYDIDNQTVAFSLRGWTVGSLLTALVRILGDPYFTLDSPWDLLNKIPLDGLSVVFDLKPNVKNRISAKYDLPRPIDFGFMKITGLTFQLVDGQVTIAITGSTTIPGMQNQPLFNPNSQGQNVQNMPGVPGRGNALFDLRLLALGQRVAIRGASTFNSVQDVVKALEGIPPTKGKSNPVNPTNPTNGQPYYNESSNWLVAADFGLLRFAEGQYTFDMMIVFNDPDLYGLRLAFNGDKAKVLAGLAIEILYKKVTDDIGLYQIDFSFPSVLRNLDFGAFSIVLPNIGIQIYTNGDFFFDFGFPYNLDFSRSFTIQAIIYPGIPVLGSAGFYFGKLSNATAKNLPQTTRGTFDPVIVFGFGAQIGVGKYFEKGPLKAGFSITVFGIIQGTIAPWHPYDSSGKPSGGTLQGDYYFWLQGTFGIIGKLYGTVDFAIIKADVQVDIVIKAQITYESYRAIPLSVSASVSIKVSIKIDLGLFSIKISFSFSATVSANLTIGSDSQAPWDDPKLFERRLRRAQRIAPLGRAALLGLAEPRFKPLRRRDGDTAPTITLVPAVQFTVLAPKAEDTNPADQQGAFVLLLATDAPTADGTGNENGSSFESLCEALLPWVIDALSNAEGEAVDLAAMAETPVTKAELEDFVTRLASSDDPPISAADIVTFLQSGFTVDVVPMTDQTDPKIKDAIQAGATMFPALSGLSVTFPNPNGESGQTLTIAIGDYTTITGDYRDQMAKLFEQLAARVESESGGATAAGVVDATPEQFADFVFQDYFLFVARQLLQAAADGLDDYVYTLEPNDSLSTILDWAVGRGNTVLELTDIATPNLDHALGSSVPLSLEGVTYTVQQKDTLTSIAARYSDSAATPRWQTTQAGLIAANATLSTLVAPGASVTVGGSSYTTRAGDSFQTVADGLGIPLEELEQATSIYGMENLLAPTVVMAIPSIAYQTAADGSDTLQGVLGRFKMSVDQFLATPANQTAAGLFDASKGATIRIANLESLYVSDLWAGIQRDARVAQTAGMVARYQMHGMRLPNISGLGLPENFAYPTGQPDYGLYQLTGQQFPTPPITDGMAYSVTIGKSSALSWLEFNGSTGTGSLALDLGEQARQLGVVLGYAESPGFDPNPTLAAAADVQLTPKRFAIRSLTLWSTSDQARLAEVTAPPAMREAARADAGSAPQAQPILWNLPETLLRDAEARQAALTAGGFDAKSSLPYLPVYLPETATTDPATRVTSYTGMTDYAFGVRIDFQVKRLAQDADQTPQTPFANDVVPPDAGNTGSAARPLSPFNYELVGPGPADAVLLERLLTAMDSLGEEIISDLFVLYPDQASAPEGLVSRASAEFLAFVTQTNLSTETNPPAALRAFVSGQQPRGIANSKAEFVKLMWELSTVRSGGYYFYYEVVGQGTGLPESLFDDSGVGTLTLVIAIDRASEPASGGRLANYVNAFVTTESVDTGRATMVLTSQSEGAKTRPLAGSETLDDLAALYGVDVGQLVSLNGPQAIVAGRQIPISGAFHQVTPAEVAAGNVLGALASYYSKGAVQPISATDIANFNPGVTASLYSVFRIPPIVYAVSADAGGPGDTFASIGTYYGLSADALANLARSVAGLFAAGVQLATDSLERDAQAALGTGNVGVDLTRANLGTPPVLPPNPTPEEKEAFAKAYLFSLYTLLSAGLFPNAFFDASPQGLSFGPRKSLTDEEAAEARHPERRRALLAAQEVEPFEYASTLGFAMFSTVNAAPDPAQPGLPAKAANPYTGVGTLAQIGLRWLDVFGNHAITPFVAPPPSYSGPLNNLPVPIDYVDRLVGIEQWPNVRSYYTYGGTKDAPALLVTFELNGDAYKAGARAADPRNQPTFTGAPLYQQSAENDLEAFTRVYFQLEQNYTNLGVPGLTGYAVSMSLANSILATPSSPLSDSDAESVRAFVRECVVFLSNAVKGVAGVAPIVTLEIPVPIASLTSENIVALDVALTLSRQAELSDPALRAIEGGLSVTSSIRPFTDDLANAAPKTPDGDTPPPPQTLKVFADALEAVLQTDDWRFRVGTGAATPGQPRSDKAFTVWAVRMGLKPGSGLTYTIGDATSFYAPKPAARELRTEKVTLQQYQTGKDYPDGETVDVTFTGADMNVWANTALAAIDNFLAPTFVAPAFIVDNLFVEEPEKKGYVARILEHKKTLANAVASTVEPVLVTSATDTATRDAAEEKLRQALLSRLSNAFIVTAVAVLPVTDASTNAPRKPGTVAPPRLFGQPLGTLPQAPHASGGTPQQNYSLTTGKISLGAEGESPDSRLAFLFSSKNVEAQPFVSLDLAYAVTYVEHDITNVPGIENYEQTSWIQFVNGPFTTPIAQGVDFPVVLRALPAPPTVVAQTATPSTGTGMDGYVSQAPNAKPGDLANWDYGFTYTYRQSAQDSITATAEFNLDATFRAFADPSDDLFLALAQFVTVYPAIAADFDAFLRKIDANSSSTDQNAIDAEKAVAAFEAIVGGVATAYDAWAKAQLLAARGTAARVTFTFDVVLADDGGDARVDIKKISVVPPETVLPAPVVLIEPDVFDEEAVQPPPGFLVSYKYKRKKQEEGESAYLSYAEALADPQREIAMQSLNVFGFQNAWSKIQVVRNKFLVPGVDTTDTFQFRTPEVKFADPIVPLLDYADFDLGTVAPEGSDVATYLGAFFESLLGGAVGQTVVVKLASQYSYLIVPGVSGMPRTALPIGLLPPTETTVVQGAPPFVAPVASSVDTWFEASPTLNASSELSFQVAIFADPAAGQTLQMPLLTILNLHVDANKVKTGK